MFYWMVSINIFLVSRNQSYVDKAISFVKFVNENFFFLWKWRNKLSLSLSQSLSLSKLILWSYITLTSWFCIYVLHSLLRKKNHYQYWCFRWPTFYRIEHSRSIEYCKHVIWCWCKSLQNVSVLILQWVIFLLKNGILVCYLSSCQV